MRIYPSTPFVGCDLKYCKNQLMVSTHIDCCVICCIPYKVNMLILFTHAFQPGSVTDFGFVLIPFEPNAVLVLSSSMVTCNCSWTISHLVISVRANQLFFVTWNIGIWVRACFCKAYWKQFITCARQYSKYVRAYTEKNVGYSNVYPCTLTLFNGDRGSQDITNFKICCCSKICF
jgi:hypothetical protein